MKLGEESLMLVPFGKSGEKEDSARYDWNNAARGDEAFVIFQYTYRGAGGFSLGGKEYAVPPGHAFIAILPEASRYYYPPQAREPWRFSWVNFYGDLALRLWGGLRERSGPVIALAPAFGPILEGLIAKARARSWRDPYEASVEAYRFHLEVLRHLRLPRRQTPEPLARALTHMRDHYREGLRMKEVADLAGMSREHFTRLFLKRTGETPAAFLRGVRVKAAARLLRTTALPVAEIAFRCGFSSATKLGTFFRRRHRLSPLAYRKRFGST